MLTFRQLFDKATGTYTYILGDEETKEAVIIDPVMELVERDTKIINELKYKVKWLVDTHVHADHVSGVYTLLKIFPDATSVYGINSGIREDIVKKVRLVKEGDKVEFGKQFYLEVYETPGHTSGCCSFVFWGNKNKWGYRDFVFTGDMMLIRACGRTDFQQGSASTLYKSFQKMYKILPEDCLVYPGHNYEGISNSYIREEKLYSKRLRGDIKEEEFTKMMGEVLKSLPLPKKIHFSVPANFYGGVMSAQHLTDRYYVCAALSYDAIKLMKETQGIENLIHFPVPGQKINVKEICGEFGINYTVLKGWKPNMFNNEKLAKFVEIMDSMKGKTVVSCKTENRSRFFTYYYFKKKGMKGPFMDETLKWVYGNMMKGFLKSDFSMDVKDYFIQEAQKLGLSIMQLAKPGEHVGHSECGM